MKKRIYISGKITGEPNYIEKFEIAQKYLESLGYVVFNPVELVQFNPGKNWIDYMLTGIALLSICNEIYMLDNWQDSRGAKIEFDIAQGMGLVINFQ